MALDFPANPTDGQVYGTYIYSSDIGAWQGFEESAAITITSPVAPASANPGDLWFNSSNGTLFNYYSDGTSSQWVEVITSSILDISGKANTSYVDSQDLLKANLSGGNSFTGIQSLSTPLSTTSGGTGTNSGTLSDTAYNRVLNPSGATYITTSNLHTGAIRITLPVGWTSHMHKFNVSVFDYNTGKSFDVVIAGYNYTGSSWVNPSAYILGNQLSALNYTVRFGYTSSGKACIYVGETTSTWNYPQVAVNNILIGFSNSSTDWLAGWSVGFVTAFENVSQTISNTQVSSGLIPIVPSSVTVSGGSASTAINGKVSFSGVSAVTLKNVFSGTFEHNKFIMTLSSASNDADMQMQFGKTGLSNLNSGYYWGRVAVYSGPNWSPSFTANAAGGMIARISAGGGFSSGDITGAGSSSRKAYNAISMDQDFSTYYGGRNSSGTAYEDIYLYLLQGGTFSGTFQMFGYR